MSIELEEMRWLKREIRTLTARIEHLERENMRKPVQEFWVLSPNGLGIERYKP